MRGPPESPWQASWPSLVLSTAQITLSSIVTFLTTRDNQLWHSVASVTVNTASLSTSDCCPLKWWKMKPPRLEGQWTRLIKIQCNVHTPQSIHKNQTRYTSRSKYLKWSNSSVLTWTLWYPSLPHMATRWRSSWFCSLFSRLGRMKWASDRRQQPDFGFLSPNLR